MTHEIHLYHDDSGLALEHRPCEISGTAEHDVDERGRSFCAFSITITRAQIGMKWFGRAELVEMFGEAEVARATEALRERLDNDELKAVAA